MKFIYSHYVDGHLQTDFLDVDDAIVDAHPLLLYRGIGELPLVVRTTEDVVGQVTSEADWVKILDSLRYPEIIGRADADGNPIISEAELEQAIQVAPVEVAPLEEVPNTPMEETSI